MNILSIPIAFLKGRVKRFETKLPVPHIGWNGLNLKKDSPFFKGIGPEAKFYFVHSYHIVAEDESVILSFTDYGYPFASSVQKGNVIGTQFHPEKSGAAGIKLLENFINEKNLHTRGFANIKGKGLAKRIVACLDS